MENELIEEMQKVLDSLQSESVDEESEERNRDGVGGSSIDPYRAEYRRGIVYALRKMQKVIIVHGRNAILMN